MSLQRYGRAAYKFFNEYLRLKIGRPLVKSLPRFNVLNYRMDAAFRRMPTASYGKGLRHFVSLSFKVDLYVHGANTFLLSYRFSSLSTKNSLEEFLSRTIVKILLFFFWSILYCPIYRILFEPLFPYRLATFFGEDLCGRSRQCL